MLRKTLTFLLPTAALLAACAPATLPADSGVKDIPTAPPDEAVSRPDAGASPQPVAEPDDPSAPRPSDAALSRGQAFVDSYEVLTLETFPPQYRIRVKGTLPTPCHQLRMAVSPPDAAGNIEVEVYSVVDPNVTCAQVLQDFEHSVSLGNLPPGREYVVLVNDQPAGTILP
ncbi:MAG: hypothetical protein NZM11_09330 [Anaerolineales bacterium]|nr:hypothetical protein [Anaerolineales bacterium]